MERTTIDISAQQSALIRDYAKSEPWLMAHIGGFAGSRSLGRSKAADCIRTTMETLSLSEEQHIALKQFEAGAACIVSGQQVGYLGGALYNVYKIATAFSRARSYREQGKQAVVVFWIEDNDHDVREAGTGYWYSREQGSIEVLYGASDEGQRKPVSEYRFGSEVEAQVTFLAELMGSQTAESETMTYVRELYREGRSWTDAFCQLLHTVFADQGLLLISAAEARKQGLMKEIIAEELRSPGAMQECTTQTADAFRQRGYHVQAEASLCNVFFHSQNGQRLKIQEIESAAERREIGDNTIELNEILNIAAENPECFSPSVLLRPIVQDYILQSTEYIAGPSELAYQALLPEAYRRFGVAMPRLVLRSGATVVGQRQRKIMERESMTIAAVLQPWETLEKMLTDALVEQDVADRIEQAETEMQQLIVDLRESVMAVDKSLEGSCGALRKTVEKELQQLAKKVRAAYKRKNEERLARVRELHAFLYPDDGLQERKLSPIYLYSEGGTALLQAVAREVAMAEASQHYVIFFDAP